MDVPITNPEAEAILPPHSNEYGDLVGRDAVDDGLFETFQVAIIDDGDQLRLDMRSIWYRRNEARYGKGFRISLPMARELLDKANALMDKVEEGLS